MTNPDNKTPASSDHDASSNKHDDGIAGFEAALKELETVVERLERGDLGLDEGLKQFERGISLARDCQRSLEQAEQRVDTLLTQDNESDPSEASAS